MFDAQGLHDGLIKAHEGFYKADRHAELQTMFFVSSPSGMVHIVAPWSNEEERAIVLDLMREKLRDPLVDGYAVTSEAWVSSNMEKKPSQCDDRREVVFTFVVPRDGEPILSTMEIDRDWTDGGAILKPLEVMDGVGGGALAELFDG